MDSEREEKICSNMCLRERRCRSCHKSWDINPEVTALEGVVAKNQVATYNSELDSSSFNILLPLHNRYDRALMFNIDVSIWWDFDIGVDLFIASRKFSELRATGPPYYKERCIVWAHSVGSYQ